MKPVSKLPIITNQILKDKLDALPKKPGVYFFRDSQDIIIYVGKAKILRSRVRSYFSGRDDGRYQYTRLTNSIRDVEVLVTRNEVEALKTEATIIRLHKPKYNVDLKDDKSYPYLKITNEQYPRIELTRKVSRNDGDYYGPYTDVKSSRRWIRTLSTVFQIRECRLALTDKKIAQKKFDLCLDYHIGRCGGPCVGKVDAETYKHSISKFVKFLWGDHEQMIVSLEKEMRKLSSEQNFEEAAKVRDRLEAARNFTHRQHKVSSTPVNQDAIGLVREDDYAAFSVLKIRGGRIVGHTPFHMDRAVGLSNEDLTEAFLLRHYELSESIPQEIFTEFDPPEHIPLENYLTESSGRRVHIRVPQRGEKHSLLKLAKVNAEQVLLERRIMAEKRDFIPRSLKALQDHLHLDNPPKLIEAFDISHLQGTDSVGSMIMFRNGKSYKSGYRIFKIKSVEGIDDFASIAEVVNRRYKRVIEDIIQFERSSDNNSEATTDSKRPQLPDLILIDGGKGQLSHAKVELDRLVLEHIPVIGLAKRLEEIFLPGDSLPLSLPKSSSALRLLQQVRDEAHRFAVTKHRALRGKRQIKSRLDEIDGIGPARRQALLRKFGSIKKIASADIKDIAAVNNMNKNAAEKVKMELNPQS